MSEKLQKYLANIGVGSRRQIETLIRENRVLVNGEVAHIGQRIEGDESITLDGQSVQVTPEKQKTTVLVYHKPEGKVCTRSDESGRETVFTDLPECEQGRWVMVGRLDISTSGLLLFTNSGELAHQLMHPKSEIEREYAVRVYGNVDAAMLQRLQKGVQLEDGPARFEKIKDAGGEGRNHWYHVVLKRGRNREVRRLWESQGVTVSRLMRIRFGSIELGKKLPVGHTRVLNAEELKKLTAQIA